MYEHKIVVVEEGWLGTMFLGASRLPVRKLQALLDKESFDRWECHFQLLERRRFLLFWNREAIIVTLRRQRG